MPEQIADIASVSPSLSNLSIGSMIFCSGNPASKSYESTSDESSSGLSELSGDWPNHNNEGDADDDEGDEDDGSEEGEDDEGEGDEDEDDDGEGDEDEDDDGEGDEDGDEDDDNEGGERDDGEEEEDY
ncbi:hypothetical protein FRC06_009999 [Ceratobasidium sp. 370]|nr:hypothetical protein FRC06_009999 [Ceratobasidium sp. 370]